MRYAVPLMKSTHARVNNLYGCNSKIFISNYSGQCQQCAGNAFGIELVCIMIITYRGGDNQSRNLCIISVLMLNMLDGSLLDDRMQNEIHLMILHYIIHFINITSFSKMMTKYNIRMSLVHSASCNWLWLFGNIPDKFPVDHNHKWPIMLSFDVLFVVSLNGVEQQPGYMWFETPWPCFSNVTIMWYIYTTP